MENTYFKKTKKALQLFSLASTLFAFKANAQCPTGNGSLHSQADVNTFGATYPTCTHISGFLFIGVTTGVSDITDLSPLANITTVDAELSINSNPNITNIGSLINITSVGGYVQLFGNSSLTNIDGLHGLTSIPGGRLMIDNNAALTNVNGLSNSPYAAK